MAPVGQTQNDSVHYTSTKITKSKTSSSNFFKKSKEDHEARPRLV